MAYDIHTTSMLIGSISGDEIKIIFNSKLQKIYTGDSIKIIDEQKQGIVAQVYQIENLDFASITDETLKTQTAHFTNLSPGDRYAEDLGSLHIAKCKIKLSIISNKWLNWRGNLPSLNDYVDIVPSTELISHTIGTSPLNPVNLGHFVSYKPVPLNLEAALLERNTLIIGDKSKDKTNLLNILQQELVAKKAKVFVIDPKSSFTNLKGAHLLEAGKNFKLSLLEYGLSTLGTLITGQVEPALKPRIENLFLQLSNHISSRAKDFIPLRLLRDLLEKEMNTPEGQKRFAEINTLRTRLMAIEKLGIFANTPEEISDIVEIFKETDLAVLDISNIPLFWQKVFLKNAIKDLTTSEVCPFIFYEDAYKYIDPEMTQELLYKSKNMGLNNIFMSNYEEDLPVELIKQADNLFLFFTDSLEKHPRLFNNLKTDKTLLNMLLKRTPDNTVLVHGDLSNNYPVMVELRDSNLNGLRNKHFGSIKKYTSEYGEIVYTYKTGEGAISPEHHSQNDLPPEDYHEELDLYAEIAGHGSQGGDFAGYEDFSDTELDQYAPSTLQQSGYLQQYKNISEEYEEELMEAGTEEGFDIEKYTQAGNYSDEDFVITSMPGPSQKQPQQQMPESLAHNIPDEEFLPQTMIQQGQPPHRPQQQPPQSIAHQIPDEEFITGPMPQPQQRQPQQRPQPQQGQLPHRPQQQPPQSIAHQIPDEEFITGPMPQPQQRQPQQGQPPHRPQQQPPQSIAHQIPDEEFITGPMPQPQQRQPQQGQPPQRPQQQPPQSIAHQIPDEEFMTGPMPQPQQRPQQRSPQAQQQTGQLRPEAVPDQLEDIPVYASSSFDSDSMEFQEGDTVQHERYGIGVINRIIVTGDKKLCSIQFQEFGRRLLDPNRGLQKVD
jgi:hypothetical protein